MTAPWAPAARPVIVLLTTSTPGLGVYVSVIVTGGAAPPGGTVTDWPLPTVCTVTVAW